MPTTKNWRNANKGKPFEDMIDFFNAYYERKGLAYVYKQHTHFLPIRNYQGKVVDVKVEEKAIVDYMGRIGHEPVAFEAKSTDNDRLMLSAVKPHQYNFLDKWTRDGSIGFVIVDFKRTNTYIIPFAYWKAMVETRKQNLKNITVDINGTNMLVTGMASVSINDLPLEWKLRKADYLETVKTLFGR